MIAHLKYATTSGGTYNTLGTLRRRQNSLYSVTAIHSPIRDGSPTITGYKVTAEVASLDLGSGFFSNDSYFWRIVWEDATYISLGEKSYQSFYDAWMTRNTYDLHHIRIEFIIPANERYIIVNPGGDVDIITADEASLI
jgi:hypothetical protein